MKKKIFVCIGDNYETKGFHEDTPCLVETTSKSDKAVIITPNLMFLGEVKEKDIKGDFKIYNGHFWEYAMLITAVNLISLRLSLNVREDSIIFQPDGAYNLEHGIIACLEDESFCDKLGVKNVSYLHIDR